MTLAIGIWLAAYLIGAIPFGYLVARARGIDIFAHGSGNIGATNVARVLGKRLGVLVFLLDFAKGAGPVLAALALKKCLDSEEAPWLLAGALEVGAGLAAFLGHLFPIYLRFKGGKGVATGAGVVCVLFPLPALGAVTVWVVMLLATRYVSLASLAAALALVLLQLASAPRLEVDDPKTLFCVLAAALVVVRHRGNIARLWHGTETRIPENQPMNQFGRTLHVLALGLWFGTAVFFSLVVALSLFSTFESLGQKPAGEREPWFPLARDFEKKTELVDGPREQGSRAAGYAVGPLFSWYFLLQGVCGFIALATSWPWQKLAKLHRWRVNLLLVALITVVIGWRLERHVVADLRGPRNEATETYLRTGQGLQEMKDARAAFLQWHSISLMLNFGTLVLVAAAMALAARLPTEENPSNQPAT